MIFGAVWASFDQASFRPWVQLMANMADVLLRVCATSGGAPVPLSPAAGGDPDAASVQEVARNPQVRRRDVGVVLVLHLGDVDHLVDGRTVDLLWTEGEDVDHHGAGVRRVVALEAQQSMVVGRQPVDGAVAIAEHHYRRVPQRVGAQVRRALRLQDEQRVVALLGRQTGDECDGLVECAAGGLGVADHERHAGSAALGQQCVQPVAALEQGVGAPEHFLHTRLHPAAGHGGVAAVIGPRHLARQVQGGVRRDLDGQLERGPAALQVVVERVRQPARFLVGERTCRRRGRRVAVAAARCEHERTRGQTQELSAVHGAGTSMASRSIVGGVADAAVHAAVAASGIVGWSGGAGTSR